MKSYTLHQLYLNATALLRSKAATLGLSIRQYRQSTDGVTTGKRYRNGAPGAFGPVAPRPTKTARVDREKGQNPPGNARNRRFARRHPHHFSSVK